MKIFIFLFYILVHHSFASEYNSISCSRNGTTVYYINGIATSNEKFRDNILTLKDNLNSSLSKIDEKSTVRFEGGYNEDWSQVYGQAVIKGGVGNNAQVFGTAVVESTGLARGDVKVSGTAVITEEVNGGEIHE